MAIGTLTNTLEKGNVDDTALGDALVALLPQSPSPEELSCIEFVRGLSTFLLSSAAQRGETDVTILDVYERPDSLFLDFYADSFPLAVFNGVDLSDKKNAILLDRYVSAAESAYDSLMAQQPCGMFMRSITDMIDLYSLVSGKAKGKTHDKDWPRFRRNYVRNVAPACFYIFKDSFIDARSFFRNTTPENLMDLMANGGVTIDDTVSSELPIALKRRVGEYLHIVPGMLFTDDGAVVTDTASEFHRLVLAGIKVISSSRIV